jgi:hypothetical protein
MSENFCKRTERRLEKLGLEKKKARRFAGFLYLSMMSVCSLMVSLSEEGGSQGITDETPRSLRHVLAVVLERMHSITGPGIVCADARAADGLSAAFGLGQR